MSKGTGPIDVGLKLERGLSWTINEHLDGSGQGLSRERV